MDMVGSSEFTLLESFITPNAAFAHLILLHFCCSFDSDSDSLLCSRSGRSHALIIVLRRFEMKVNNPSCEKKV